MMDDKSNCNGTDLIQLNINLFGSQRGPQLWQVNGLMLVNTILMGVVVGVGAYAPRYSRHPVIGFLHLGATILFLPIVSLVATTVGNQHISSLFFSGTHITSAKCSPLHIILALIWTGVVLIIGINTRAIVATDEREGRSIAPPTELLIKAIWTAYLTLSTIKTVLFRVILRPRIELELIVVQLFVIMFTKLLFKYSIFFKARQSFAFRRSPRLIAGYMSQLLQLGENQWATASDLHVSDEHEGSPPALVVMGEDSVQVEKQPHGYNFKSINSKRLVTLDRIWRLTDNIGNLLGSSPTARPKDVCFSFALFKLLRCRFANYTAFEAGFLKAHKFFLRTLLHGDNFQRVFGVIEDELSFIHDYYYSSLPISYSHHLLPLVSVALSLYSIAYCLYLIAGLSKLLMDPYGPSQQIICRASCRNDKDMLGAYLFIGFGNIYFDAIPLYLVLAALMLAEIRDIVFYMCSNWTKVALICGYVHHASRQQSPAVQKHIGFVLKHFRSKLVHSWADKMNQCSILLKHRQWVVSIRLQRLLCLPNQKKIKVPSAVKEAIFKALKRLTSEDGLVLEHIQPPSPPISGPVSENDGGNASPAHDRKHIAYTILLWHIATSVFEMGHPQPSDPKIAATHLSRYCAYLVSCSPDLLPDDDEWCKQLYKDVKKDADRILSTAPKAQYEQLVQLLSVDDLNQHEVLKNGARLGKKLVDSSTGWEELARFWSEVILYVAPSENLEGQADAIARGGELITLLWTLLQHAGVVGRHDAGDLTIGADAAATDDV